jgi:hypothetical protein
MVNIASHPGLIRLNGAILNFSSKYFMYRNIRRILLTFCAAVGAIGVAPVATNAKDINNSVETFGNYILYHWQKDPELSKFNPPQIITNVDSKTKVLGACVSNYNGRIAQDVGGTSYCSRSNTIYVVQDQLSPLFKYFGPTSIAYVISHEYGHYLQTVFQIPYKKVVSELQADCMSGAILGQGASELGITSRDMINMSQAAYTIGDPDHGSGAQRAYAVYAGFGLSAEITCSTSDMEKLSLNKIKDPVFKKLASKRSAEGIDLSKPQSHLRSISASLGYSAGFLGDL